MSGLKDLLGDGRILHIENEDFWRQKAAKVAENLEIPLVQLRSLLELDRIGSVPIGGIILGVIHPSEPGVENALKYADELGIPAVVLSTSWVFGGQVRREVLKRGHDVIAGKEAEQVEEAFKILADGIEDRDPRKQQSSFQRFRLETKK